MRLNKKGLSLIEIVISIALISVITLFMYRLLADVTFQKDNEYFASLNQQTRAEILSYMYDNYNKTDINNVNCTNDTCSFYVDSEMVFSFIISKSNNKMYFTIMKNGVIDKNWYLAQITGFKIIKESYADTFIFNIELYTNNLENNENNNNKIDDLWFVVNGHID